MRFNPLCLRIRPLVEDRFDSTIRDDPHRPQACTDSIEILIDAVILAWSSESGVMTTKGGDDMLGVGGEMRCVKCEVIQS